MSLQPPCTQAGTAISSPRAAWVLHPPNLQAPQPHLMGVESFLHPKGLLSMSHVSPCPEAKVQNFSGAKPDLQE